MKIAFWNNNSLSSENPRIHQNSHWNRNNYYRDITWVSCMLVHQGKIPIHMQYLSNRWSSSHLWSPDSLDLMISFVILIVVFVILCSSIYIHYSITFVLGYSQLRLSLFFFISVPPIQMLHSHPRILLWYLFAILITTTNSAVNNISFYCGLIVLFGARLSRLLFFVFDSEQGYLEGQYCTNPNSQAFSNLILIEPMLKRAQLFF